MYMISTGFDFLLVNTYKRESEQRVVEQEYGKEDLVSVSDN